eukprot:CCRYP_019967-RA/>CCRYP_019967-RA protein AED:0.00 eAED:0.00 QI:165/-1/1/1/-1/1/1/603/1059
MIFPNMTKKKSSIKFGNKNTIENPAASSTSCGPSKRRSVLASVKLVASITATILILSLAALGEKAAISNESQNNTDTRKEAFLKWILENGGLFHPILQQHDGNRSLNVTLEEFPSFGGWGLALVYNDSIFQTSQEFCSVNSTDSNATAQEQCQLTAASPPHSQIPATVPIIRELDPLFTIPSSLIITIARVLETYASSSSPQYVPTFRSRVHAVLRNSLHGNGLSSQPNMMGLIEQDVVLAVYLMVEDCQHANMALFGEDSWWGPYLEVLPGLIPRLDTFEEEHYEALNDAQLESVGRESRTILQQMFLGDHALKSVLLDMIGTKIKSKASLPVLEMASCTSFRSFHRFVAIISSRAMVLRGEKRVVPLAEMINYAPRPKSESRSIRPPFDLFHTLGEDGSMTVRSDRNVYSSNADLIKENGLNVIQLFEDYGPVDSSLFLEAHGFVPDENPNHCAMIAGPLLLSAITKNAVEVAEDQIAVRALMALGLVPPPSEYRNYPLLQDVCVRNDSAIIEDGSIIGRRPASDSIAVISLMYGAAREKDADASAFLREACYRAVESDDVERIEIRCARYPGSSEHVKGALKNAARMIISQSLPSSDTEKGSIIENNDSEMSRLVSKLRRAEVEGDERMTVAWRFRLEERRILLKISSFKERTGHDDHTIDEPTVESDLHTKLREFESFIERLNLPVNKIEPRIIGSDLRIGTYAKESIDVGDVYLSLPPNAVIDSNTVFGDDVLSLDMKQLLKRYKSSDTDDFMVLLIYLIHERFIMKEQSRWWPYLNLLPTIEEMKLSHPLFYHEEEINRHLAGSDIRRVILRYQQRTAERHEALSSDLNANLVLGSERLRDNDIFYWACAIIDSRSIWWDGKRHLAPLLDLVNADSIGKPHETREEATESESYMAVTRATRHVQRGQQLYENYGQPNHSLLTYHGFILENNPNDCAFIEGLFIHRGDPGASNARLLRSMAPSFCIKGLGSIHELAHFFRVKHNLPHVSSSSITEDVRLYLIQELEQRVSRLKDLIAFSTGSTETAASYKVLCMEQLVRNDLKHFENALKLISL